MEQVSQRRQVPVALVAALVAAGALALASPLFALPVAPVLVVAGAVALRRSSDPLTRGLAWGALIAGVVLLAIVALLVLGMAASVSSAVSEGIVEVSPGP